MGRKRYTSEEIISMLREAEVFLNQGSSVGEICRKLGISEQTYYRWRKDYGGMRVDQAKRLKELEKENVRLKKLVADMSSAPQEVGSGALEGYVDFQNDEIIRVLQEVQVPITCINSDKYQTNAEANQQYAPSFKAMIMSGVGHFNMMEDPETFNRLLEETVQEFVQMAKSK